jgi:hypothetical protein
VSISVERGILNVLHTEKAAVICSSFSESIVTGCPLVVGANQSDWNLFRETEPVDPAVFRELRTPNSFAEAA